MPRDPYSLTVDGLWELLEGSADFSALVLPGNRVKFIGDDRAPVKADVSGADVPEVRIIPTGSLPHQGVGQTSSHFADHVRFDIQHSSGDQRLDAIHFPLYWIVFGIMSGVEAYLRNNVEWNGINPIRMVKNGTVHHGVSQKDLNRGIVGWSSVWSIEVSYCFERALVSSTPTAPIVSSVTPDFGADYLWNLSKALRKVPSVAEVAALKILIDDNHVSPIAVWVEGGGTRLRLTYPSGTGPTHWSVEGSTSGLSFIGGGSLATGAEGLTV